MDPTPGKGDPDTVFEIDNFDSPKCLGLEVFDPEIPIHNEAQSGKLAGTVTDDFVRKQIS